MTTEQITEQIHLTTQQLARVTQAMRNAREHIEFEQQAPIDLDQASTIHDLCVAMMIDPVAVLDSHGMALIDDFTIDEPPTPPLIEVLEGEPKLLAELGRVTLL